MSIEKPIPDKPIPPVGKPHVDAPTHPMAHPMTHPTPHAGAPAAKTVDPPPVPPPPVIIALFPPTAAVGDPTFVLRVNGTGFTRDSVIIFAGHDEPTTYFSDESLTTGMNMDVWLGPDTLSAQVRNPDGQLSNVVSFVLQPPRAVPLDPAAPSKPTPAVDQI